MTTIRVHFDGKVFVPDEPVDLPVGTPLRASIEPIETPGGPDSATGKTALQKLAEWAASLPDDPDAPTDGAAEHDHYLYGQPKKP